MLSDLPGQHALAVLKKKDNPPGVETLSVALGILLGNKEERGACTNRNWAGSLPEPLNVPRLRVWAGGKRSNHSQMALGRETPHKLLLDFYRPRLLGPAVVLGPSAAHCKNELPSFLPSASIRLVSYAGQKNTLIVCKPYNIDIFCLGYFKALMLTEQKQPSIELMVITHTRSLLRHLNTSLVLAIKEQQLFSLTLTRMERGSEGEWPEIWLSPLPRWMQKSPSIKTTLQWGEEEKPSPTSQWALSRSQCRYFPSKIRHTQSIHNGGSFLMLTNC